MQFLGVSLIANHADYRLLGKQALAALVEYKESSLFLRGIIPNLGFSQEYIYYNRQKRIAGTTKYTKGKIFQLGINGLLSFTVAPLRILTMIGFSIFLICLGLSAYAFIQYLSGQVVHGWASTVLPLYLLGGLQLLSIGVLGEYIAQVFETVKARPRYIIEKTT